MAGDLFIDLVMTGFPALPGLGEEGFASACHREAGGGAANTASGLARLGLRSAVFAVAGADSMGWMEERFSELGVDTSLLIEHPTEPTALTVAVSTPADRIFYTYYGANALFAELLADREQWRRFQRARHVHFGFPVAPALLRELAVWLHSEGIGVSIDVGWQQGWLDDPMVLAALSEVDWFLPNEHEAGRITGEGDPRRMLAWFRRRGARGVVLKLGAAGSAVLDGGTFCHVPAVPVDVVDTTGAGDCFNAGFLYAALSRFPMEQALRLANFCGGLSTRAAGGIAGFPQAVEAMAARFRNER
ncbi:carbohydrate kinase family protein [Paludibaculum fermentans]|uniref:carbohydrate kinase family protein n=1 Tax=Paludibaculum fermentans TaxID=1473598 RepID=UPI003EB8A288